MADSATLEYATVGPTGHVMDSATAVGVAVADAVVFPTPVIPDVLEECSLAGSFVGLDLESTVDTESSAELVEEEQRNRIG